MTPQLRSFFVVLILGSSFITYGQQPAPGTKWILRNVSFESMDPKIPFNEAVKASGLKIGQTIDLPLLQDAINKLVNSGLFKEVGATYKFNAENFDVKFKIIEAIPIYQFPCMFDNFIGIPDEDIKVAIKKVLPNYEGTVNRFEADSGKMEEVLNVLIKNKNFNGKVVQEAFSGNSGKDAYLIFRIDDPNLKVCSIEFPGSSPKYIPNFNEVTQWMVNALYSRTGTHQSITSGLIPIYKENGHLRVKIESHSVKLGDNNECKGGIVVEIPVIEGPLYGFDKILWMNNQALSTVDLDDVWTMKRGDVPSFPIMAKANGSLVHAYNNKGYMAMKHSYDMDIDDSNRTYSLKMMINEGARYSMGKFVSKDLSETELQKLTEKSKLKYGEKYDGEYVSKFLMSELKPRQFSIKHVPVDETLTVNIEIKFVTD